MKKNILRNAGIVFAFIFMFAACTNAVSSPSGESDGKNKTVKPEPGPVANPFREIPLTLEALEDTTITLSNADLVENLKYSINGGGAEDVPLSESIKITLLKDSCISFYGEGTSNTSSKYFNINCSADCYIYGNVMSLLSSDFKDKTEIRQDFAFNGLFRKNTHIKNSTQKELLLPATSLAYFCYGSMFSGCTSLETAPALPATSLARHCYNEMFAGCTSLTAAPALPATRLADLCYISMFAGCTSLTEAPVLPATSLAYYCYYNMFCNCTSLTAAPALPVTSLAEACYECMFQGCTSLKEAPALPATSLAKNCYYSMFYGCTSLTKAPALPAKNLADSCYEGMFFGCASLTAAPVLRATSLAKACYSYMFNGCTSLETAPELPATSLAEACYDSIFFGCTSLETAPELPATSLAKKCYYCMFYGCNKLNYVKCLATDIPASYCLDGWLDGVASTGTFEKAASATWAVAGTNGIPAGWTVTDAD